jgi:hypothetical protein
MMVPGYWTHETSGVLRPAVEAYLNGGPMTPEQLRVMRAYLRQWIKNGPWVGPTIPKLLFDINFLFSRRDIERWLNAALQEGIDPL